MNNTATIKSRHLYPQGLTLVEVMLVIAVLVILVVIALPTYQDYVERADRANAVAEMTRLNLVQQTRDLKSNSNNNGNRVLASREPITIEDINVNTDVAQKYQFTLAPNATGSGYRIYLTPKLDHYHLSAWMSSSGDVYECKTPESAQAFMKTGDCIKKV